MYAAVVGTQKSGGKRIMINIREALRYAGIVSPDDEMLARMTIIADKLENNIHPRSVYRVFQIERNEDSISLSGTPITLHGEMANRMLEGSKHVAVFLCTLGSQMDQMIRREVLRDAGEGALVDACANAYIEAVCDQCEQEIAAIAEGYYLTDRFSPGYGDLPLDIQPLLLEALNGYRAVGVSIGQSLLMTPMKSVTAMVGLCETPDVPNVNPCDACLRREDCTNRIQGRRCHA